MPYRFAFRGCCPAAPPDCFYWHTEGSFRESAISKRSQFSPHNIEWDRRQNEVGLALALHDSDTFVSLRGLPRVGRPGDDVLVSSYDDGGNIRWEYRLPSGRDVFERSPFSIDSNGLVCATLSGGNHLVSKGYVKCFDAKNGGLLWEYYLDDRRDNSDFKLRPDRVLVDEDSNVIVIGHRETFTPGQPDPAQLNVALLFPNAQSTPLEFTFSVLNEDQFFFVAAKGPSSVGGNKSLFIGERTRLDGHNDITRWDYTASTFTKAVDASYPMDSVMGHEFIGLQSMEVQEHFLYVYDHRVRFGPVDEMWIMRFQYDNPTNRTDTYLMDLGLDDSGIYRNISVDPGRRCYIAGIDVRISETGANVENDVPTGSQVRANTYCA